MGVWIETLLILLNTMGKVSLPAWECGLKPLSEIGIFNRNRVTPRVGVWIETSVIGSEADRLASLPAWECGLKRGGVLKTGTDKGHSPRGSVD